MNRIAVSTLSLLPRSWGPGGVKRAYDIALKAELDGLQILPILGLTRAELCDVPKESIIAYESSWNQYSVFDLLKQFAHGRGLGHLNNLVMFGTKSQVAEKIAWFKSEFPDAYGIDLPDRSGLVEISPKNNSDMRSYLLSPHGLVLDTWHIREGDVFAPYHDSIRQLVSSDRIRLIHLQTRDKDEFNRFRFGLDTEMEVILSLAMKSQADIVIEVPPLWIQDYPDQHLWWIKERIMEVRSG